MATFFSFFVAEWLQFPEKLDLDMSDGGEDHASIDEDGSLSGVDDGEKEDDDQGEEGEKLEGEDGDDGHGKDEGRVFEENKVDDGHVRSGEGPAAEEKPEDKPEEGRREDMDAGGGEEGGEEDGGVGKGDKDDRKENEEVAMEGVSGQGGSEDRGGDAVKGGAGEDESENDRDQLMNPDRVPAPELAARWKKRREILNMQKKTEEQEGVAMEGEEEDENGNDLTMEMDDQGEKVEMASATKEQQRQMEGVEITAPEDEEGNEDDEENKKELKSPTEETRKVSAVGGDRKPEKDLAQNGDEEEETVDGEEEEKAGEQEGRDLDGNEKERSTGGSNYIGAVGSFLGEDEMKGVVDEVERLREEVDEIAVDRMDVENAEREWRRLEAETSPAAAALCEKLRLLLEPTLATRLAGDFRTGKRLSMRRVIEFVASDYRRDRIWLRRTRPEKVGKRALKERNR